MVLGEGDFSFGEFVVPEVPKTKKAVIKEVMSKFANLPVIEYGKFVNVSYSQFSLFKQCPHKWYRTYVTKEITTPPAIHFTFGTSIHEVLQQWMTKVYESTLTEASKVNWEDVFKDRLLENYQQNYLKHGVHFSTPQELNTIYKQGVEIIRYFFKNRTDYFNTKHMHLIGVEIPIFYKVFPDSPVRMLSYLDIVFYDTRDDTYIIFDIKTGRRGWSKYDKQDKTKISQLLLYKYYFSLQYDIPIEKIKVAYILTKREVFTEGDYPEKRITVFSPAQGKPSIKATVSEFEQFVTQCFDLSSGSHLSEKLYIPVGGLNFGNCRFCPLQENQELCPKEARICI